MRLLLWLILAIGGPFYEWNAITTNTLDGQAALVALLWLLSIGALYYESKRARAKAAQQRFWLDQGRK